MVEVVSAGWRDMGRGNDGKVNAARASLRSGVEFLSVLSKNPGWSPAIPAWTFLVMRRLDWRTKTKTSPAGLNQRLVELFEGLFGFGQFLAT